MDNKELELYAYLYSDSKDMDKQKVEGILIEMDSFPTHPVTKESIEALLQECKKTNCMNIFIDSILTRLNGRIHAYDGTNYLHVSSGEYKVKKLELNGVIIWSN